MATEKTKILNTIEVEGTQYAIVDTGVGNFVDGMFARYILVPVSTLERTVRNQ